MNESKTGAFYAICAYGLWGFFPIYWKLLKAVPAIQILFHRMTWSLLVLLLLLFAQKQLRELWHGLKDWRSLGLYFCAAMTLAVNWGVYIYAVNAGYVVESSLGYFINPLVSVAFGMIFFAESLRRWQWLAIFIAVVGVSVLTWSYGKIPWIALVLAFSFAIYGVLKKRAPLNSLQGLSVETLVLFFPALGALIYFQATGEGVIGKLSNIEHLLLALSGFATTIPLLCFAAAAQRIPLSSIGIYQFIAPTIQFLLGVYLYNEDFDHNKFVGFTFIWIALALFLVEGLFNRSKDKSAEVVSLNERTPLNTTEKE